MPPFTLGQAAKATGRSKAGILDAIRGGRLSASRDDKNQWQIDPAELHRVYPLIVQWEVKTEQDQTPLNAQELRHFQEKIGFLERIISGLESERDNWRERFDKEAAERREAQTKLTALLAHQPEPKAEPTPQPEAAPAVRPVLWFGLAVSAAIYVAAKTWESWWPWLGAKG